MPAGDSNSIVVLGVIVLMGGGKPTMVMGAVALTGGSRSIGVVVGRSSVMSKGGGGAVDGALGMK